MSTRARRLVAVLCLLPGAASAADFTSAAYDSKHDELVVGLVYLGTHAQHRFSLEWGRCSASPPYAAVARVIDAQGGDAAREEYRVQARFSLAGLKCRPASVTLRMGRIAHIGVEVPAAP